MRENRERGREEGNMFLDVFHSSALPVHCQTQFFFRSWIDVFQVFRVWNRLKLRSMLDLVLGGVLEACWSDLGRLLGGQDAPKMAQDGAKMRQDAPKTRPRRAKTLPGRP